MRRMVMKPGYLVDGGRWMFAVGHYEPTADASTKTLMSRHRIKSSVRGSPLLGRAFFDDLSDRG
jgi:hypothetical protein